jgi:microcystin-dependent protein
MTTFQKRLLLLALLPYLVGTGLFFSGSYNHFENIPQEKTVVEPSPASQEGMIGEVRLFAGNFAPRGWAKCEGQLLPISSYSALFSILGTTYGGDGRTTFALPDLRGRAAIGPGNGPGLSNVNLGSKLGQESAQVKAQTIYTPTKQVAENRNFLTKQVGNPTTIDLQQPSLAVNYIICLQGVFPSRN